MSKHNRWQAQVRQGSVTEAPAQNQTEHETEPEEPIVAPAEPERSLFCVQCGAPWVAEEPERDRPRCAVCGSPSYQSLRSEAVPPAPPPKMTPERPPAVPLRICGECNTPVPTAVEHPSWGVAIERRCPNCGSASYRVTTSAELQVDAVV